MTCDKHGYDSFKQAQDAIDRRQGENPTITLRSYMCPKCGKRHITSKPERFGKTEEAS